MSAVRTLRTIAICLLIQGCGSNNSTANPNEPLPKPKLSSAAAMSPIPVDLEVEMPARAGFDWTDSKATPAEIERRIVSQFGCNVELEPVALARWLIRNRVVRSVGPGADGHAILVPRKRLLVLGVPVRTIEGWGTVDTKSGAEVTANQEFQGQVHADWPFAMNAGMKSRSVLVTFNADFEEVKAAATKAVPCAYVANDSPANYRASPSSGTVSVGHAQ